MVYIHRLNTKLGEITLASDGENLIGLWLDGQKHFLGTIKGEIKECNMPIFDLAKKWLEIYFSGEEPNIKLPIKLKGTPFRMKVWEVLKKIPYGQVVTYGDIAKSLGIKSARAVGGAVGHNPISIIIPCHRVIGANGKLTGYAGGIDKKIALLQLERINIPK